MDFKKIIFCLLLGVLTLGHRLALASESADQALQKKLDQQRRLTYELTEIKLLIDVRCDDALEVEKCLIGLRKVEGLFEAGYLTHEVLKYNRQILIGTEWNRGFVGSQQAPFDFKSERLISELLKAEPDESCDKDLKFGFSYFDYVPGTSVLVYGGRVFGSLTLGDTPQVPSVPLVYGVRPHFAADRAGLQNGDVVKSINGLPITSEKELADILSYQAAPYKLVVKRGDKEVTVALKDPERVCDFRVATGVERYMRMLK